MRKRKKGLWFNIRQIFKFLFGENSRPIEQIRLVDSERLHQGKHDKDYARNYNKLKKTYYYYDGKKLEEAQARFRSKGRIVKYWKLVCSSSDSWTDEYIPIFYKKRKRRKKHHVKTHITKRVNLIDYCKRCHKRRVFKENKAGQYQCNKCGWRDSNDW